MKYNSHSVLLQSVLCPSNIRVTDAVLVKASNILSHQNSYNNNTQTVTNPGIFQCSYNMADKLNLYTRHNLPLNTDHFLPHQAVLDIPNFVDVDHNSKISVIRQSNTTNTYIF